MSELLTLEIPDELAKQARALASATHRRFEDAVVEWIEKAVAEPAVEALPDEQLIKLCDAMMEAGTQAEISELLERQREGLITAVESGRLDHLLGAYRRGLVTKARALKEAVARGIKPRLAGDAA